MSQSCRDNESRSQFVDMIYLGFVLGYGVTAVSQFKLSCCSD